MALKASKGIMLFFSVCGKQRMATLENLPANRHRGIPAP